MPGSLLTCSGSIPLRLSLLAKGVGDDKLFVLLNWFLLDEVDGDRQGSVG